MFYEKDFTPFYVSFLSLCSKKGVSPSVAARDTGISSGAPTAWKKGAVPKPAQREKLCTYFGVTDDTLLGYTIEAQIDVAENKLKHLEAVWDFSEPGEREEVERQIDELEKTLRDLRAARNDGKEKAPAPKDERTTDLSPAFFRLKQGLEPYDLSESDADFLVEVYKAHLKNNQ